MPEASYSIGTGKQKILFKCITQDQSPIILTGNVPELGEWNLADSVSLYSNPRPNGGFEWTAQAELPLGRTLEYKFVRKTDSGFRWESGNNHRITVIPALGTLDSDFRE